MPRPTARVLTLLELLQGGGLQTVRELAQRLGVDERTVRRYVAHIEELGVPVESVRGRYGGYRIAAGSALPPLMLTDDEAVAVVVALAASPASAAASAASAKIRRVLPASLAARLTSLLVSVHLPSPRPMAMPQPAEGLLVAVDAMAQKAPLSFHYLDRAGRGSRRTVLPAGLVARDGHWYLAALDSLSGEERVFRIDRMRELTIGEGAFELPGVDPDALVDRSIAYGPWRYEVVVRVLAASDLVRRALPIALVTEEEDGWCLLKLGAERLDWVARAVAMLDAPFDVQQPVELQEELQAFRNRLSARLV